MHIGRETRDHIIDLLKQGFGAPQIAIKLKLHPVTVDNVLREHFDSVIKNHIEQEKKTPYVQESTFIQPPSLARLMSRR